MIDIEQKDIYTFATKAYYTAGHAEIDAQGDIDLCDATGIVSRVEGESAHYPAKELNYKATTYHIPYL